MYTAGYLPKGVKNLHPHTQKTNLCKDIYSNFIHNCHKLQATKMSLSREMRE